MATAGKSKVATDTQPTPTETAGTEALVGTAGVGVTEVQGPTFVEDAGKDGKVTKGQKDAQATIDKYTNNKTAKANAEVGKVGEDKGDK